jgi:pyrroloquinoline quinone (PQQ) biosynthesis protein C
MAELIAQSHQHRAVRHPYLRAMSRGDLPDPRGALRDFARHYHGYSSHFPRYLTALISRLEDDRDRCLLLDNVHEESGCYSQEELRTLEASGIQAEWVRHVPHPELFRRFRRALGVADDEPEEEHPEVIAWRELLLAVLSQGSAAEAVGALGLGTEGIVPVIYPTFVDALRRLGDVAPRDGVFFPLHTLVDDHHQASLQAIARKLGTSPRGHRDLSLGMTKALAWELGPQGIRVNTVCPTFIETAMTAPMLADAAFAEQVRSRIALGRLGQLEDVMGAFVFLASDASALVTGTALMVDGGWTAA